ncbi:MAG TPA: hypothetical protein VF526_15335 [Solirubrobacteraceae bacterium]|jgi:hypothetical protein
MAAVMTGTAETGLTTAKFVRRRLADGYYWSTAGTPAFAAFSAASIADYGVAATETGVTGQYTAADPDPAAPGDYLLLKAAGASLAVADLTAGLRWQDAAGPTRAVDLADAALAPAATALSAAQWTSARAALLDYLDAAVTSRLASAGYTAPLSAASTRAALGLAAADLDAQLGAILASGGTAPSAADIWSHATRALSAGDVVALAAAILARLTAAGTTVTVGRVVPSDGGTIVVYQGDDYKAARSRELSWTVGGLPDLAGAAVSVLIYPTMDPADETGLLTLAGSYTPVSAGEYTLAADMARAQSAALSRTSRHLVRVRLTLAGGDVETVVEGDAQVR